MSEQKLISPVFVFVFVFLIVFFFVFIFVILVVMGLTTINGNCVDGQMSERKLITFLVEIENALLDKPTSTDLYLAVTAGVMCLHAICTLGCSKIYQIQTFLEAAWQSM